MRFFRKGINSVAVFHPRSAVGRQERSWRSTADLEKRKLSVGEIDPPQ